MKKTLLAVAVIAACAAIWLSARRPLGAITGWADVRPKSDRSPMEGPPAGLTGPTESLTRSIARPGPEGVPEAGVRGQIAYARGGWAKGERVRFYQQEPQLHGGDLYRMGELLGTTIADEDGRFSWGRSLNSPPVVLCIAPEDKSLATITLPHVQPGPELRLWLQEAGGIMGQVLVRNTAYEGARVEISTRQDHGHLVLHAASTSSLGEYAFERLAPGPYVISAVLPGGMRHAQPVRVHGAEVYHQDFRFGDVAELTGVVRASGTLLPIHGAEVDLDGTFANPVTTGPSGEYTISAPPSEDPLHLSARASGFVNRTVVTTLDGAASGVPARVSDILLERGSSVVGRVVRLDSSPIEGAAVTFLGFSDQGGGDLEPTVKTSMTDDDGRFAVEGVGDYRECSLVVAKLGFGTKALGLQLGEQAILEVGDVALEPGGRVFGLVRSKEGAGVFEVILTPRLMSSDSRLSYVSGWIASRSRARTGPGGAFSFSDIGPGAYTVRARLATRARHWEQQVEVEVPHAGAEVAANFDYLDGLPLGGIALDPDGAPVSGLLVELIRESDRASMALAGTSSEGVFLFDGVPPANYTLSLRRPQGQGELNGLRPVSGSVVHGVEAGQDDLVVRLPWATRVSGVLLDSMEQVVPNAYVAAMQGGYLLDATFSSEDGSFVLQVGEVFELVAATTRRSRTHPERLRPDNDPDRQVRVFHVEPDAENLLVRFPFVVD